MKLIELVDLIKDKLNDKNIFTYYDDCDGEKYMILSIYWNKSKTDEPEIYMNEFWNDVVSKMTRGFSKTDFVFENLVEYTREEWQSEKKKNIKKSWDNLVKKKPEELEYFKKHLDKDTGKIVYEERPNRSYKALVAASSSDEDYYWVLIDRYGKLSFHSACDYVDRDFIEREDDKSGYEYDLLKEYLKNNKKEIREKLDNMDDVLIYTLF